MSSGDSGRVRAVVHDYSESRGFGFLTVIPDGATAEEIEAAACEKGVARTFFHKSAVLKEHNGLTIELPRGTFVTCYIVVDDERGGKAKALDVRDRNGKPFGNIVPLGVNMNVSGPGRHVGIIKRCVPEKSIAFARDCMTGGEVFVPPPAARNVREGSQIEFTPVATEKGMSAQDVTAPMGAPLFRVNPHQMHHGMAPPHAMRPSPKAHAPRNRPVQPAGKYGKYEDEMY